MKKYISFAASFAGLLLFAVACEEFTDINEQYRPAGSQIVFSASSEYNNGVATKTEYSGDYDNPVTGYSNPFERINWVANDPITVYYLRGTSTANDDYTVSAPTNSSNAISQAALSGGQLYWADGTGDHVFYAMYPANGFGGNNSASLSGNTVSGNIPATQTITPATTGSKVYKPAMNYAYMVARETIAESSSDTDVVLHFMPAMTAFEFRFKVASGDQPVSVTGFTMSSASSSLSGTFKFDITGGTGANRSLTWTSPAPATTTSDWGSSINVSFGSGVQLTSSDYLDITLFALPVTINDVTITFTFANGTTKSLALKHEGSFVSFAPCKKHVITNDNVPGGKFIYVVEEIEDIVRNGHTSIVTGMPFTVRSYRYPEGTATADIPANVEAVPWKLQYSFYNEITDTWSEYADLGPTGAPHPVVGNSQFGVGVYVGSSYSGALGITGNGVGVSQYAAGEQRDAVIVGDTQRVFVQGANTAAVTDLSGRSSRGQAVGTGNGPFDLSRHPFYGSNIDGSAGNMNSANCYVVTAPGYYMFPCVYGNAIMNGQPNVSAYDPGASSASISGHSTMSTLSEVQEKKNVDWNFWTYYNPHFYNAVNEPIADPYIVPDLGATDLDAVVVWQDTPSNSLIIPFNGDNIGLTNVSINSTTVKYIWFKIDPERIQPGNIIIALRGTVPGKTSSKTILWSWHVWVTEKNLAPTANDTYTNNVDTFTLMPYNLGWVDTSDGDLYRYPTRSIKYRVVQTDGTNALPIDHQYTGDDSFFTVTQIGEEVTVESSIGNNPFYQWGRKDPMIPALAADKSKIVTPNPEYSSVIPSDGGTITAQIIGTSPSPNYSPGIQQPYLPLINFLDASHGVTGWVGGVYYPWYKYSNETHTLYQVWKYVNPGQPNDGRHYSQTMMDTFVNNGASASLFHAETRGDYYWYNDGAHSTGPWRIDEVEEFVLGSMGLNINHFTYLGYTAAQRTNSSAVMNLWNSYIYQEDVPNSQANKFKTVYDPCPAGFTVPTNKAFLADTPPSQMTWLGHTDKVHASTMPSPSLVSSTVPAGVNFGNMFFPFTGDRVYISGALKPMGFGTQGLYWTDNPFQIDWAEPGAGGNHDPTAIEAFSFHHSAYMFIFDTNLTNNVQAFTRGSACTIRPMVDPKYNPGN